MKERPILFNSEMVRAILEGRKTQTRRIVKPQPQKNGGKGFHPVFPYKTPEQRWNWVLDTGMGVNEPFSCPFGVVGDVLWVRETFTYCNSEYIKVYKDEPWRGMPDRDNAEMRYEATEVAPEIYKWRPSIHMPRWASRISLEITDIKVERLNDISAQDALNEGVSKTSFWKPEELNNRPFDEKWWDDFHFWNHYPQQVFKSLWQSVYGQESWNSNPWVWAISFRRIK